MPARRELQDLLTLRHHMSPGLREVLSGHGRTLAEPPQHSGALAVHLPDLVSLHVRYKCLKISYCIRWSYVTFISLTTACNATPGRSEYKSEVRARGAGTGGSRTR